MELWAVYMFPFMTSCFNTRTNQPSTGNLFRTTSYFGIILYTQFLVKLKLAWYGLFKDICSHSKKVSNLLLQQASSIKVFQFLLFGCSRPLCSCWKHWRPYFRSQLYFFKVKEIYQKLSFHSIQLTKFEIIHHISHWVFLVKLKLTWYGLFKDISSHTKKVSNLLLQ